MPEVQKYLPGTPCWVDVTSNIEDGERFYGGLFGWTFEPNPDPAAGGYGMFTLDGKNVAGMAPSAAGIPPLWSSYVSVEDVDTAARLAQDAGGQLFVGPMTVLDVGRMAVVADPTGAMIGLWQPNAHAGADVVNEPNTLCWNELQSRDLAAATPWYTRVFGWDCIHLDDAQPYTDIQLDGQSIGGMMSMPGMVPAEIGSYWAVYFRVESCSQTVSKAKELGGNVLVPPTQIPPGTFATLTDPQGAAFNVLEFGPDA